ELGSVGIAGLDAVGEGLELLAVELQEGQRVEHVRRLDEVRRPVDAKELALVPGAVGRVLDDDVELFARLRVVVALDVEMAVDLERRDNLSRVGVSVALTVDAVDRLVGEPSVQDLVGDLPFDAPEIADEARENACRDAEGDVDD